MEPMAADDDHTLEHVHPATERQLDPTLPVAPVIT
jgi:hypothetical protein